MRIAGLNLSKLHVLEWTRRYWIETGPLAHSTLARIESWVEQEQCLSLWMRWSNCSGTWQLSFIRMNKLWKANYRYKTSWYTWYPLAIKHGYKACKYSYSVYTHFPHPQWEYSLAGCNLRRGRGKRQRYDSDNHPLAPPEEIPELLSLLTTRSGE